MVEEGSAKEEIGVTPFTFHFSHVFLRGVEIRGSQFVLFTAVHVYHSSSCEYIFITFFVSRASLGLFLIISL